MLCPSLEQLLDTSDILIPFRYLCLTKVASSMVIHVEQGSSRCADMTHVYMLLASHAKMHDAKIQDNDRGL